LNNYFHFSFFIIIIISLSSKMGTTEHSPNAFIIIKNEEKLKQKETLYDHMFSFSYNVCCFLLVIIFQYFFFFFFFFSLVVSQLKNHDNKSARNHNIVKRYNFIYFCRCCHLIIRISLYVSFILF
jgi:hypothetical protein